MKKFVSLLSVFVLLLSVVIFTLPAADNGGPDTSFPDPGDGGGGGADNWRKSTKDCPDKKRTKTLCTIGGWEACTATYCN